MVDLRACGLGITEEKEMHGEDGCQSNSVESYTSAASTEAGRREHEATENVSTIGTQANESWKQAPAETAGVGMMIGRTHDNRVVVNSVAPGSPAEEAGIRRGHRILAVNGMPVGRAPFSSIQMCSCIAYAA